MKRAIIFSAIAALAIGTATSANAAETAELKVTGTITPDACTPTLSGGGVVDFGKILVSSLKYDEQTSVGIKFVDLRFLRFSTEICRQVN